MAHRGFLFSRPAVIRRGLLCLFTAFVLSMGGLMAQEKISPLAGFLPSPKGLDGWTIKDESQAYEGDDLFIYIDGGAEIYHEYGFVRVLAQDYWKGERSISLEIFEMKSSDSAFGMFAFKRSPNGRRLGIGSADSLEDYYLNVWKGRFLITLTGMNADEETIKGIQVIAQAVAGKIGESAAEPALLKTLPAEGLVVPGVKYIKGQLGLYNIYAFFTENIFRMKEAVKADYADGTGAYVFRYDSTDEAAERFAALEKAFPASPKYRNFVKDGAAFRIEDDKGGAFRLGLQGRFILMISNAASVEAEVKAFGTLSRSVSGSGL